MRYFGGKVKIAKELTVFLNLQLKENQSFYDLFCGSCNVISKINPERKRYANDLHKELIALLRYVQQGNELPSEITENYYNDIKSNRLNDKHPDWIKGFVGFGCSYSGKYFGGIARCNRNRNYALDAKNSISKKFKTLKDVSFTNLNYSEVPLDKNSLVYCDIPYKNTTRYSTGAFDHAIFYEWAKEKAKEGHNVLVSEYKENVPSDWEVVMEISSKKDIRDTKGEQVTTTEVLMKPIIKGN